MCIDYMQVLHNFIEGSWASEDIVVLGGLKPFPGGY